MAAAVWLLFTIIGTAHARFNTRHFAPANRSSQVVGADELPDEPTPVMLVDLRGRTKWTVHIPENSEFPLAPDVYAELCSDTDNVAAQLSECRDHSGAKACSNYYHVDKSFVDVQEAQDRGLIPKNKEKLGGSKGKAVTGTKGRYLVNEDLNHTKDNDAGAGAVCEKSLTYVLESDDPGLGNTLMGLWMAYGLALKEHRAFFIDDRRW